jgi:KDO2-lipid IV(A) lauroyltransferase
MSAKFDTEGPLSQDKLFISRKGESTDAASSILRAARVIKSGNLLFIAGDVRWSGQMTEEAVFLGQTLRFSTTWVVLAAMTSAPVVGVYCRIGEDRRFEVDFQPAFQVPRSGQQPGGATEWVQRFLDQLQDQIRKHPENSNDYLFWKDQDGEAA